MPNPYFRFKQFTVHQGRTAMKVTTDACLFGALIARMQVEGGKDLRLLDIGAGTGLLSLMAAQELPYAITAVEQAGDAAGQAAENFAASPWAGRFTLWHGDILEYPNTEQFDLIVSNPPFYERELEGPEAGRNAAHHGTALRWRDLFPKMRRLLKAEGKYYLLLPYKRKEEALQLLAGSGLPAPRVTEVCPVEGKPPTRLIVMNAEREWERIVIKDVSGNYTPEFIGLLRPYYLFL